MPQKHSTMAHVYPAVRKPPKSRIPSLRTSSHFRRHSSQLELLKKDLQRKIFIEREKKLRILSARDIGHLDYVVTPQIRKVRSQPASSTKTQRVLVPIESAPKSSANRRYSLKSPVIPTEFYDNETVNGMTPSKDHVINGNNSDRMMSPGMQLDFEIVPNHGSNKVISDTPKFDDIPKIGGKLNKTPVLPPISRGSDSPKPSFEEQNNILSDIAPTGQIRQNIVSKTKEGPNFSPQPKTGRSPFPPAKIKSDHIEDRSPAPVSTKVRPEPVKDQSPLPTQLPDSERGNLKLIIKRKEEELLKKIAAEEKRLEQMHLQEEEERKRAQERRLQMEENKRARISSYKSNDGASDEISINNQNGLVNDKKKSVHVGHKPVVIKNNVNHQDPIHESTQPNEIKEFYDAPIEGEQDQINLVECSICGRRFGEDRLAKHMQVCNKLSQKRDRKKYDMTKKRAEGTDYASYVARGAHLKEQPKAKKKDWKAAHQEFQQIVQCAKTGAVPPPVSNPDYETCQYCNRRFNEGAYNRHVVHCKEKNMRQQPVRKVQRKR